MIFFKSSLKKQTVEDYLPLFSLLSKNNLFVGKQTCQYSTVDCITTWCFMCLNCCVFRL